MTWMAARTTGSLWRQRQEAGWARVHCVSTTGLQRLLQSQTEKHVFVWRTQEALSVARVRGNCYVWKKGLQAIAYGAVVAFRRVKPGSNRCSCRLTSSS